MKPINGMVCKIKYEISDAVKKFFPYKKPYGVLSFSYTNITNPLIPRYIYKHKAETLRQIKQETIC